MCWDFFDKVYCISVYERTDRRAEAKTQFARVGLSDRVEFVLVKKHPTNSEQGIYESHMDVIRTGIQAGARRILVFEDDILFERFSMDTLRRCIDFMAMYPSWKLLFLGCLVRGSRRTVNGSVLKIRYGCLTQAYTINRQFAETIVDLPWNGVAFDDFLRQVPDEVYAIYPSCAFQSNLPSDNDAVMHLDKFRRLLGGLRRIQKRNEFYHRHKAPIIFLQSLAALAVLLFFLL